MPPEKASTEAPIPVAAALTPAQERKIAIEAYHDAGTPEAKAAVVAKYPLLKAIYSSVNHS